jgi:hypothetical protein
MLTIKKINREIPIKSIPPLLRFGSSIGLRTIPVSQSIRRANNPEQISKTKYPQYILKFAASSDGPGCASGRFLAVSELDSGNIDGFVVGASEGAVRFGSKSVVSLVESLATMLAARASDSCCPSYTSMKPGMNAKISRMSRFRRDQNRWKTTNKPIKEKTDRTTHEGGSVMV